jgi:hypothetical protein
MASFPQNAGLPPRPAPKRLRSGRLCS